MAVNEALSALSTTAASNTPSGGSAIGSDLDDHLRDIKKNIAFVARWPVQAAKTGAYTTAATDLHTVLQGDASGGAFSITLLAAATAGDGHTLAIVNTGASGTVTVDGNASETIDGETTLAMATQYDSVVLVCDGSNWLTVSKDITPTGTTADNGAYAGTLAQHRNLVLSRPTAATVDVDADIVLVEDTSGVVRRLDTVNLTVNITSSGANGLDTGAEAGNTWYYVWVIYDGTTTAGLLSTSATAPTMPGTYTYKGLVGVVRNDATPDFVDFQQINNDVSIADTNVVSAGSATSFTLVDLSAVIPPNATAITGYGGVSEPGGSGQRYLQIAADSGGTFGQVIIGGEPVTTAVIFYAGFSMMLPTAQNMWYRIGSSQERGYVNIGSWRY